MKNEITPQMVKNMREKTGCGMNDAKKSLQICDGDEKIAVEYIRLKGQAVQRYKKDEDGNKISYEDEDYVALAKKIIEKN